MNIKISEQVKIEEIEKIIISARKSCESGWFVSTRESSFDTRRLSILLNELDKKDKEILALRKRVTELEEKILKNI